MSVSREEFSRCKFCIHYVSASFCRMGGSSGECDPYSYREHSEYKLDPDKAISKAKELGIGVSDILALIEACN